MKTITTTVLRSFLNFFVLLSITFGFAQELTVSDTGSKILKDGNPITLRGVNFGNWLLWEGYMMNLDQSGIKSNSQIREGLKDLLNNSETNIVNFETAWRENYITNSDFVAVKQLGFNVIRIPFHYNMFWNTDNGALKNDGFVWLDKAINWASANNMYVIFCMHAAPGYQNPDHHSDNPGTTVDFWNSSWDNVEIAKNVWKHIANRYKNYAGNQWLAGYDLLNEPVLDDNKNRLMQAYKEMTASIRSEDANHLIFAEGNYYSSDFYDMQERWDSNLVFSNHYYGPQGESNPNPDLNTIKSLSNNLNIPLWLGEYGENTASWVNLARTDYDSQNVGWAFWAWKRQETDRAIYSFNTTNGWNRITDYLKFGTNKPNRNQTQRWLNGLINKIKLSNASFNNNLYSNLIPSTPVNEYVWLRNNTQFVTSNNGVGPMTTNKTNLGTWEKFQIVDAGDNKIALKGNNNEYVNSQNGNSAITCNSTNIAGWESFEWFNINGQIALKGFNGKFISTEGGASSGMNCNRETVSGWEAFDWGITTSSKVLSANNSSSTEKINTLEFVLYPNPTESLINYSIENIGQYHTAEVFNIMGSSLLKEAISENKIDVSNLLPGHYVLKVSDENGLAYTQFFVKE